MKKLMMAFVALFVFSAGASAAIDWERQATDHWIMTDVALGLCAAHPERAALPQADLRDVTQACQNLMERYKTLSENCNQENINKAYDRWDDSEDGIRKQAQAWEDYYEGLFGALQELSKEWVQLKSLVSPEFAQSVQRLLFGGYYVNDSAEKLYTLVDLKDLTEAGLSASDARYNGEKGEEIRVVMDEALLQISPEEVL